MVWTLFLIQRIPKVNDLTVIIPVHNEDPKLVTKTWAELKNMGCYVIVVDDGDTMLFDETVDVIHYKPHVGYGYAIKQGIQACITPIIITMDGDGQHTVEDVVKLYQVYKLSGCKMVIGSRWNLKEKPLRWIGRKLLNFFASVWAKHYLIDLNSGMRIFDTELARSYSSILCDTFSFTTSLTMCIVTDDYKVCYFPIDVKSRASGKSHVKVIRDGLITFWYICWIGFALRTRNIRAWLRGL